MNQFTMEDIKRELEKRTKQAQDYLNDNKAIDELFEKVIHCLSAFPYVGKTISEAVELIELVKSYVSDEYREISTSSIVIIVCGLLYIVSPLDLITDYIPFIGILDDIAAISFVSKLVEEDLKKFRAYKKTKKEKQELTQTKE